MKQYVVLALLFAGTSVLAQPKSNPQPKAKPVDTRLPWLVPPRDVALSSSQILLLSTKWIKDLDKVTEELEKRAKAAKKAGDMVLFNCIERKLRLVKLAHKAADNRYLQLVSAIGAEDNEERKEAFERLSSLVTKATVVALEAEQCKGAKSKTGKTGPSIAELILEDELAWEMGPKGGKPQGEGVAVDPATGIEPEGVGELPRVIPPATPVE